MTDEELERCLEENRRRSEAMVEAWGLSAPGHPLSHGLELAFDSAREGQTVHVDEAEVEDPDPATG